MGEFRDAISKGSMTMADANARHYDEVWKRVAGQLDLEYTKVLGDPRREMLGG